MESAEGVEEMKPRARLRLRARARFQMADAGSLARMDHEQWGYDIPRPPIANCGLRIAIAIADCRFPRPPGVEGAKGVEGGSEFRVPGSGLTLFRAGKSCPVQPAHCSLSTPSIGHPLFQQRPQRQPDQTPDRPPRENQNGKPQTPLHDEEHIRDHPPARSG